MLTSKRPRGWKNVRREPAANIHVFELGKVVIRQDRRKL